MECATADFALDLALPRQRVHARPNSVRPRKDTATFVASQIDIQALDFEIEGKPVLQGLDLSVDAPRIGVIGRNGSGKSTLARLIAGLVAPTSGKVRLNGIDPFKDRRAALGEVGILFQNPDHQIIFPTVIEEISFGLLQSGQDKATAAATAKDVLARFGLAHWEAAYVNTLSHGQKHLLCLMAIVAMQPKVLLLDEPFAGLDLPTKMQLTRSLRHYDGTLFHISHDPADLQGYDVIVWLEDGRIRSVGQEDEVLEAYQTAMQAIGARDDLADLSH